MSAPVRPGVRPLSPWVGDRVQRWCGDPIARAWVRVQVGWITRWSGLPGWLHAIVVLVAGQLVTAAMLDRAARFTVVDGAGNTEQWPYLSFIARWDSAWYRKVAQDGYPETIPRGPDGLAQENAWAFYPLYPLLCRGLLQLGVGWPVAGWLVSLACATGAAVLLRSLVARLAGPGPALWSVAMLAAFPTAAVLQFPYTESLALVLLLSVLWCLQRRRYVVAVPLVLLLGLTRPIGVPIAAVVGVHVLLRLTRRARDRVPAGQLAALGGLLAAAGAAAVAWPVTAALVTGERGAYTDTMAAWREQGRVEPFTPWLERADLWLGPSVGRVLLALTALGLAVWLTSGRARALGADLRVWCVAYVGYLALVLDPTTSLARYLLLLFPLGVLLVLASPSTAYRRALVVASFTGQLVWIVTVWRLGSYPP